MWTIFIIVVLLLIWITVRVRRMSILKRSGIPGPEPHLIFGNIFDGIEGKTIVEKQKYLIEKYGKIVGYYIGARFNVLVADPDLAKLIQVKDFQYFTDRIPHTKYLQPSWKSNGAIINARGEKWKQIRAILTPTFSSAKLKAMTPIVDETVNSFLRIIEEKAISGQEFDIYDLYLKLTAEVIINCAFGLRTDFQNESDNEFLRAAKTVVQIKVNKIVFLIFSCFPEINPTIHFLRSIFHTVLGQLNFGPFGVLWKMSSDIIRIRKQNSGQKYYDLLQAMLDSKYTREELLAMNGEKLTTVYDKISNQVINSKVNNIKNMGKRTGGIGLTEDEIRANCIFFFAAGYETSSTALAYVTHFLVNFPDVQNRLREEINELFEREGKLDYNTITGLQYMEWVLNEAMRLYPPLVTASTRECLSDYKYQGMTIPKGAMVAIATHYLHKNPEYWPQPEVFDPMRFSPENRSNIHQGSWQPFGDGPRNCIGMRFAYLVMKLSLAKLLLNYSLDKSPRTENGTLTTKCKLVSMTPSNGVWVKVNKL